jgi:uncharacterized membrane protein YdjX (TVP38/TMEM64 family)
MTSKLMRRFGRPGALVALVLGGLAFATWGPLQPADLLEHGRAVAGDPRVAVALVAINILLYVAALPGTVMIWAIAPFYHPALATLMLIVASTLGAIGAYFVAAWLGGRSLARMQDRTALQIMSRRGDFFTQCALRMLPGFPHSVVNYGAGFLHLPLLPFVGAAVIGLGVKWVVYTTAIYGLAEAGADPLSPLTLVPLVLLAVLLLGGGLLRRRLLRLRSSAQS